MGWLGAIQAVWDLISALFGWLFRRKATAVTDQGAKVAEADRKAAEANARSDEVKKALEAANEEAKKRVENLPDHSDERKEAEDKQKQGVDDLASANRELERWLRKPPS